MFQKYMPAIYFRWSSLFSLRNTSGREWKPFFLELFFCTKFLFLLYIFSLASWGYCATIVLCIAAIITSSVRSDAKEKYEETKGTECEVRSTRRSTPTLIYCNIFEINIKWTKKSIGRWPSSLVRHPTADIHALTHFAGSAAPFRPFLITQHF